MPTQMFALKFFNLCPALDGDLLQFPGGHEHQGTKVSRGNQWENGSTGRTNIRSESNRETGPLSVKGYRFDIL
jgi:hypothetical protein